MALVGLFGLSLLLMDDGSLAADPNWPIVPYYSFLHWVSGRRIASIRVALDASDPITAAYMARHAAQGTLAHAP